MYTCLPRVPFRVPKPETMKVGSRITSSPIKTNVAKRLGIMTESTEAPLSAAEGILAGLNKQGSMVVVVRTRNGSEAVLAAIAPLIEAAALAKQTIWCECMCVPFRRISLNKRLCATPYVPVALAVGVPSSKRKVTLLYVCMPFPCCVLGAPP